MAQAIGDIVSATKNHAAPSPRTAISTRHSLSSQLHHDSISSSKMAFPRSSSKSPPGSTAFTLNPSQDSYLSRPRIASPSLPSRQSSPDEYALHSDFKDLEEFEASQSYTVQSGYQLHTGHYHEDPKTDSHSNSQAITIRPEEAQRLTTLTDTSIKSEDGELKKLRPTSSLEGHPIYQLEASDAIEVDSMSRLDSPSSNINLEESSCEEDDDVDYAFEERWVPTYREFEARVLRATENNFSLAAQLMPQLYEIFQQEKSPVVGFWEAAYHERPSHGERAGVGGWVGSHGSSHTGHSTHRRKRNRGNDEDNGEGSSNNQNGDSGGNSGNGKGSDAGEFDLRLACPFYKRFPKVYNGSYRTSSGTKVYKTCFSGGFANYQRFREHLERVHSYVQCERCSFLFTDFPQEQRELEYHHHRDDPLQCHDSPPSANEGITPRKWAEIKKLQNSSKAAAAESNLHLDVVKWNNVWSVLFPGVPLEHPYYTAHMSANEQQPSLDEEIEEFKNFYVNDPQEYASDMEKAVAAYRTCRIWFIKQRIDSQFLQDTQQQMSGLAIGEYAGPYTGYAPLGEGHLNSPIPFPSEKPFQGQNEGRRVTSLPGQTYPSGPELQYIRPDPRRVASDGVYTASGYTLVGPQPITTPSKPIITHFQNQQNYQPGDFGPTMTHGATGLPINSSSGFVVTNLKSQNTVSTSHGGLGSSNYQTNHQQYNNGSPSAPTSDVDTFHQTNLSLPPQPLQYNSSNANQTQPSAVNQRPTYASVAGTMRDQMPAYESIQQQTGVFSNQNPNPKHNNPSNRRR